MRFIVGGGGLQNPNRAQQLTFCGGGGSGDARSRAVLQAVWGLEGSKAESGPVDGAPSSLAFSIW